MECISVYIPPLNIMHLRRWSFKKEQRYQINNRKANKYTKTKQHKNFMLKEYI
jgi:hypothetical protein